MNRIYRKVWNKALGQLVVASELASSQGAGVVMDGRRSASDGSQKALSGAIALALAMGLGTAGAPVAQAQSVEVGGNAPCVVLNSSILDNCVVDGSANASGSNAVAIGSASTASGGSSVAAGAGSSAETAAGAASALLLRVAWPGRTRRWPWELPTCTLPCRTSVAPTCPLSPALTRNTVPRTLLVAVGASMM